MIKVLVYPKDINPYQDLLYNEIDKSIKIKYLLNPVRSHALSLLLLPLQLMWYRYQRYNIFHLHWVFMFRLTLKHKFFHSPIFKLIFSVYFIFIIFLIKMLRYKLIWTVHDIIPHDAHFLNDKLISRFLSYISDAKIIHSRYGIKSMREIKMNTDNTFIIPIGNYLNIYKNSISQNEARIKLHISGKDFVYGYFGRVEKYKGIIGLIRYFQSLNLENTKLLIAGQCNNDALKKILLDTCSKDKKILLYLKHIPSDEVDIYINAVDIFTYPFTNITTSSSVILNMSFGKPTIAPLLGDINDLPIDTGYFYNKHDEEFLFTKLMIQAKNNKNKVHEMGKASYLYSSLNSWENSAHLTAELYSHLIKNHQKL